MILKYKKFIFSGIIILTIFLNICAWCSSKFCDAYIMHIFPVWVNTYGRITGIFPFSVGELLIVAGLLLVLTAAATGVLQLLLAAAVFITNFGQRKNKTEKIKHVSKKFNFISLKIYEFFVWVFIMVCLVMTLNCFILYHATPFSEKYFQGLDQSYDLADVIRLRNEVVEKCNEYAVKMERDDDGRAVFHTAQNSVGESAPMQYEAIRAMKNLGQGLSFGEQPDKLRAYPQLDGFYPRPKAMYFSDFMCQQYMQGYYFPFSMEANYNDVMYVLNKPFTMCHELAHLRGYIFEDEANFIGYLACVQSENEFFRYSGYLCAFAYLESDIKKAGSITPNAYENAIAEVPLIAVRQEVYEDDIFVEKGEWDRINTNAVIPTETVDKAADVFIDTNLKINGVKDGALSYNRMVNLLMMYYS